MPTPTEINLNDATPAPPTGHVNGKWQTDLAYPDPSNPTALLRDASVYFRNLGGEDPRTTTSETIGIASQGKVVTLTNASAIAVTLDSTVPAFFMCFLAVEGAGVATLTPSSGTIDGQASLAFSKNQSCALFFNGTNWWTIRGRVTLSELGAGAAAAGTYDFTAATILVPTQSPGNNTTRAASTAFVTAAILAAAAAIASSIQDETFTFADDTGSANTYVISLTPAPTLVAGSFAAWLAANSSTGASTLNADGTARPLKKNGGIAIGAGDVNAGQIYFTVFDGTNWQIIGGGGSAITFSGDVAGTSTVQEVVGILSKAIDGTTPTDGQILQYSSTSGKWEMVVDRPLMPVSGVGGKPSAGQLVLIFTAGASMIFPANFATPNSQGSLGTNPTSTALYSIYKNGTLVGTVSISTSGVFTFATQGGTSFTLNAGDRLTMVAPGSQDATLADVSITLVGQRSAVVSALATPPIFAWRGTYSGSTAYSPFDVVAYTVSSKVQSYVCIAATTGNVPTNASFWTLLAQAGADGANGSNGTNGTNGTVTPAQVQSQAFTYAADTGTANAYIIALSPTPTLSAGYFAAFIVAHANTGASTLNADGTARAIKKSGSTALASADLSVGQAVVVVFDGTNWQWIGGGGGGGGDLTAEYIIGATDASLTNARVWPGLYNHPDAPPSSAGSLDDEFDTGSLNLSRWTWRNQGTAIATLAKSILCLIPPATQGERVIYQSAPATPWEVTAKLCVIGLTSGQNAWGGITVMDSGSTSLVDFQWYPFQGGFNVMELTSNTGFGSNAASVAAFGGGTSPWVYLRIGDDGTNLYFKWSIDGVNFTQIYHQLRKSYLSVNGPNQVGIIVDDWSGYSDNAGIGLPILSVDWFRRTV